MAQTREPSGLQLKRLLERLTDVELAEQLRTENCDGPTWLVVREDLARVALGTLHRCVLHGELAARTRRIGRPAVLTDVETALLCADPDERSTIVTDAVVHGLVLFRDRGILAAEWVPERSSLRTYAVNACLLQASTAVRGWRRRQRPHERLVAEPEVPETPHDADSVDLDAVLALLPAELHAAAVLRLRTGRSWASIAPEIGTTARRLEHQLRRFREEYGRRNGGERP